ncbi:DNA-directed RNA polymerase subunit epsilon [Pullulanibacillus sp. KACC 23026]|uniref:DNA-dependent RNA polymerase subunit epsilon n=1 Tax=Pullulanibacillus sp. KACC 23026 TaxID=3028315 RepID=UPI0023B1B42A|nr:DNA-directed RNA polymerase subunit epsilon [Pullulanibacillus sp. KACC 23026]WEG11755.1 DNA-directed RNA polymerase subunit epsilon [Pullulanibacillus sp. KACC 23026]
MIYKVLYQESIAQVPVREHTHSMFVEAESEREVRKQLANRGYNIEFIQAVDGKFLEYEMQSQDFKVEKF